MDLQTLYNTNPKYINAILIAAISLNDTAMIKHIKNTYPTAINTVNNHGETPLIYAIYSDDRNPQIIKLLLESNADIFGDMPNEEGPIIDYIIDIPELLEILMETDHRQLVNKYHMLNNYVFNIRHYTDIYGRDRYMQIIKMLLDHGADINQTTPGHTKSVREYAKDDPLDTLTELLDQYEDPTIQTKGVHMN